MVAMVLLLRATYIILDIRSASEGNYTTFIICRHHVYSSPPNRNPQLWGGSELQGKIYCHPTHSNLESLLKF